jgi:hypothetical protein
MTVTAPKSKVQRVARRDRSHRVPPNLSRHVTTPSDGIFLPSKLSDGDFC